MRHALSKASRTSLLLLLRGKSLLVDSSTAKGMPTSCSSLQAWCDSVLCKFAGTHY